MNTRARKSCFAFVGEMTLYFGPGNVPQLNLAELGLQATADTAGGAVERDVL
jgi:hypothetical protein